MKGLFAMATLGRPMAGKTTLGRFVCTTLGAQYIPEAAIKRCLRPEYVTRDSLDEELRDLGYRAAIEVARACLEAGTSALVDAAFHRRHRRRWFYEAIAKTADGLILLYCRCDNPAKVAERIALRARSPKSAETQADSIEVHRFIDAAFEEPVADEFPAGLGVAIFDVDTDRNECPPPRIIAPFREAHQSFVAQLHATVRAHLDACRSWPAGQRATGTPVR